MYKQLRSQDDTLPEPVGNTADERRAQALAQRRGPQPRGPRGRTNVRAGQEQHGTEPDHCLRQPTDGTGDGERGSTWHRHGVR